MPACFVIAVEQGNAGPIVCRVAASDLVPGMLWAAYEAGAVAYRHRLCWCGAPVFVAVSEPAHVLLACQVDLMIFIIPWVFFIPRGYEKSRASTAACLLDCVARLRKDGDGARVEHRLGRGDEHLLFAHSAD